MRPRSRDRGNRADLSDVTVETHASMRPRSRDRGNHPSWAEAHGVAVASMRPRSRDRGNDISIRARGAAAHRFNEAAIARSRERQPSRRSSRRRYASMRPRSRDRGNRVCGGGGLGEPIASMRPRSRDRGNHRAADRLAVLVSRFNEAAIARSREHQPVRRELRRELASMRPRSRDRGNRSTRGPGAEPLPCFNEAAIARSREPICSLASTSMAAELQ